MERKIFTNDEMKYVILLTNLDELILATIECSVHNDDTYHRELVKKCRDERLDIKKIRGGGRILVDHIKKIISAFDESGSYGKAKTAEVKTLLENAMTNEGLGEYGLTISDTKD